jgi:NAD(P)-dependent dehydrogenase (short-subunit alcohol dehydrogenase family)
LTLGWAKVSVPNCIHCIQYSGRQAAVSGEYRKRPRAAVSRPENAMPMRLEHQVAVVTGAGSGIGRASAVALAVEGASVVLASRQQKGLDETLAGAPKDARSRMRSIPTDVADPDEVDHLFKSAVEAFGGVDLLVAAAGIAPWAAAADTDMALWSQVIGTNLTGVFLCCRAAIPLMKARGGGSIINIGSTNSVVAEPDLAAYCASKGGVMMLTRSIALDYGKDNIRANCLCPTWTETPMVGVYFDSQPDPKKAREEAAQLHPLKRYAQPEDIANIVVFLASKESSIMTGSLVMADGGFTTI